jgi:hypothetical protein
MWIFLKCYSLQFGKESRLRQRYGLQSTTLTSYFYSNKLTYVYFYESILQDKSTYAVFTSPNSMT